MSADAEVQEARREAAVTGTARRLEGKRAVAVGAGQSPGLTMGIGRATALLFAREGARLLLVDKDPVSVEETAQMITKEGGSAAVHVADITDDDSCRGIAAAADSVLGGADVLFNSVGIVGVGSVAEVSLDAWDHVLDLNLTGQLLPIKHILPIMIRQHGGSIISISSVAAPRGSGAPIGYAVSKAGVNRLIGGVASEYASHNIRANAIMPGLIDTPMAIDRALAERGLTREQYLEQREATVPMDTRGTAMDIAYAALYFASDESRYVSGAILPVDGARLSR